MASTGSSMTQPAERLREALRQHDTVCALVRSGELERARSLAATIEVEHLRAEALKVAA